MCLLNSSVNVACPDTISLTLFMGLLSYVLVMWFPSELFFQLTLSVELPHQPLGCEVIEPSLRPTRPTRTGLSFVIVSSA